MNAILFCLVIASTAYTVSCLDTWWDSESGSEEDVCQLQSDSGTCYAYFPRYYYNYKSGQCEKFIYGGCKGNGNNFKTIEDCMKKCPKKPPQEKDVCKLPKETGPCRAAIPRFYFNSETGTCEEFIYGGCQGNGNNFRTKEQCVEKCVPSKNCPKNQKYYDCKPICNTCEIYGTDIKCKIRCVEGCFCDEKHVMKKDGQCVRQEECGKGTGPQVKQRCMLPPKRGTDKCPCTRYYYNYKSGTCEKFTYGGCRGNANNFRTEEDCLKTCITCPPHSKFSKAGPACEGCGIRCLAIIEKPNCYCEPGYGRKNAADICRKC